MANDVLPLPNGFKEIALGIMADGKINASEAEVLLQWLEDRPDAAGYPIRKLCERLSACLRYDSFDDDDGKELLDALKCLLEDSLPDWMQEDGKNNKQTSAKTHPQHDLPYDQVDAINMTAIFCFTGVFAYGGRSAVEQATMSQGGQISRQPVKSQACYVVVGSVGSRTCQGNYGKTLEMAFKMRDEGAPVQIISENVWANALKNN